MAETILQDTDTITGKQPSHSDPHPVVIVNDPSIPIPVSATIDTTGLATSAKQDTQITAEQAIQATLGATNGAAVITDANGTLQQYLRGLVKLLITSGTIVLGAGTNNIGDVDVLTLPALVAGTANIGDVDIVSTPKATSATNAIVAADGTALASNANRKAWSIQNLDDAAVYVKMGASASASDFNVVLKAGTAANDGNGGFFSDDMYTGIVTILAAAGSPRVVVTEL